MSFILDALKKSESERQRQTGPALLEMRIAPAPRALPAWAMIVGALLVLSVVVLGWLALRPGAPPPAAPLQASSASGAASAYPGAGAAPAPASASGAVLAAQAPVAPVAAVAAAPGAAAGGNVAATDDGSDAPANPADYAPALVPARGASAADSAHADLKDYAALSGTVPELRLDLHVYAPDPADRYAFINMRKVREGDITPEGVQVRQITRDGVIVQYHGTEFLLGRQ